jgi:hypothetical protein
MEKQMNCIKTGCNVRWGETVYRADLYFGITGYALRMTGGRPYVKPDHDVEIWVKAATSECDGSSVHLTKINHIVFDPLFVGEVLSSSRGSHMINMKLVGSVGL